MAELVEAAAEEAAADEEGCDEGGNPRRFQYCSAVIPSGMGDGTLGLEKEESISRMFLNST